MKLTETTLRKMIQEERNKIRSKGRKRINESIALASEGLFNAMTEFLDAYMEESGDDHPDRACDALRNEVEGFCSSFSENY